MTVCDAGGSTVDITTYDLKQSDKEVVLREATETACTRIRSQRSRVGMTSKTWIGKMHMVRCTKLTWYKIGEDGGAVSRPDVNRDYQMLARACPGYAHTRIRKYSFLGDRSMRWCIPHCCDEQS